MFLPILVLCVCNSWIAIALAKARRNTEALFNTISSGGGGGGGSTSNGGGTKSASAGASGSSSSRHPAPKLAFYSKYRKSSAGVDVDSCVSMSSLKPASSSATGVALRKHSAADCFVSFDSESEYHQKLGGGVGVVGGAGSSRRTPSLMPPSRRMSSGIEYLNPTRSTLLINSHQSRPSGNIHIRGQKSTQHISIMLFAVSIGFVILNLPFAIRTLFHRQYQEDFKVRKYAFLKPRNF